MTGLGEISLRPVTLETLVIGGILILLLIMSGFVSGSEPAYFSLKPQELESINDSDLSKDKLILRLLGDPQRLLATILIANNLINVSIVMLSAFFSSSIVDFGDSKIIQFLVETVIITSLILLVGEIIPKIFAQSHRLSFARILASPLNMSCKVLAPFSQLLMKSSNAFGARLAKRKPNVSQDDLSQALELTSNTMADEKEMLEGIVKFMSLEVRDIMTPRVDVQSIKYDADFSSVRKVIVDSGFSRLPVIGDRPDDIRGVIYVKDVLRDLGKGNDHDWQASIRKCYFVPESKKVNDMLREFQTTKNHMAIIVDEYGCMQGIITLEDIIEEIVGDINDEKDADDEKDWYRQADGSYVFEAKISLNDLFKVLDIDSEVFEKARGDAETLAGLLLEKNGIIPKRKDVIEICGYKFEILSANIRKINKVILLPLKSDTKK